MLRIRVSLILITLLAIGAIWSLPSTVEARDVTFLVFNNTPESWGVWGPPARDPATFDGGKIKTALQGTWYDAIFKQFGFTEGQDFLEIIGDDIARFDRELWSGEWDVIVFNYHIWRDSPDLQAWIQDNGNKLKEFMDEGHGVISTGGRDPEDRPLVALWDGMDKALAGFPVADKCCLAYVEGTPLTKDMVGGIIDTSKSPDPTFVGDGDFPGYDVGLLPGHATVAAEDIGDPNIAIIVYGRVAKGAYVLSGSAEITNMNMGFGQKELGQGNSWLLWRNMIDWFEDANLRAVNPKSKLPMTWAQIKTGR